MGSVGCGGSGRGAGSAGSAGGAGGAGSAHHRDGQLLAMDLPDRHEKPLVPDCRLDIDPLFNTGIPSLIFYFSLQDFINL